MEIVKNWTMVKQYPYLVGDFMLTAWDYLGEAGIGTWAYTNDGHGCLPMWAFLIFSAIQTVSFIWRRRRGGFLISR